jgi:hypothetical protein
VQGFLAHNILLFKLEVKLFFIFFSFLRAPGESAMPTTPKATRLTSSARNCRKGSSTESPAATATPNRTLSPCASPRHSRSTTRNSRRRKSSCCPGSWDKDVGERLPLAPATCHPREGGDLHASSATPSSGDTPQRLALLRKMFTRQYTRTTAGLQ